MSTLVLNPGFIENDLLLCMPMESWRERDDQKVITKPLLIVKRHIKSHQAFKSISMAFASNGYGSGTAAAGERKRTYTSSDNPLFVTPANYQRRKKRNKTEMNEIQTQSRPKAMEVQQQLQEREKERTHLQIIHFL